MDNLAVVDASIENNYPNYYGDTACGESLCIGFGMPCYADVITLMIGHTTTMVGAALRYLLNGTTSQPSTGIWETHHLMELVSRGVITMATTAKRTVDGQRDENNRTTAGQTIISP